MDESVLCPKMEDKSKFQMAFLKIVLFSSCFFVMFELTLRYIFTRLYRFLWGVYSPTFTPHNTQLPHFLFQRLVDTPRKKHVEHGFAKLGVIKNPGMIHLPALHIGPENPAIF